MIKYTIDDFLRGEIVVHDTESGPSKWIKYINTLVAKKGMRIGFEDECGYFWWVEGNLIRSIKSIHTTMPVVSASGIMDKMKVKVDVEFVKRAYNAASHNIRQMIRENVDMFEGETTEEFVRQMIEKHQHCSYWAGEIKKRYPELDDRSVWVEKANIKMFVDVKVGVNIGEKHFGCRQSMSGN